MKPRQIRAHCSILKRIFPNEASRNGLHLAQIVMSLLSGGFAFGQPVFDSQPQSQTNVAGTTATFTVIASGTEPLFYQWQFNAFDINTQTNTSLVLTNVQSANAGSYTVVVTNIEGAVRSEVANLTVIVPPRFSAQPVSQSVSLGANAAFSFTAGGTPPLYYWLRFEHNDLPGRTNLSSVVIGTLVVSNTQLANAGDYTVVVTNLAGSATSQVAHLDVDPTFTKINTGPIVTSLATSAPPRLG
jgi:hypothetical protein